MVPGVEDFIFSLDRLLPIAAVIPKPSSIDSTVLSKIASRVPIMKITREQIVADRSRFISSLISYVGGSRFVVIDTRGYFSHILTSIRSCPHLNLVGIAEDTENGHQKYQAKLREFNGGNLFCPIIYFGERFGVCCP